MVNNLLTQRNVLAASTYSLCWQLNNRLDKACRPIKAGNGSTHLTFKVVNGCSCSPHASQFLHVISCLSVVSADHFALDPRSYRG